MCCNQRKSGHGVFWRVVNVMGAFFVVESLYLSLTAPFSPPSTASDPRPVGGNFGGSDPNSTRGIRKNGFDHLEIRPSAVLHPLSRFGRSRPPDTPALKAATCTNVCDCGGNLPASMAMRGLA